MSTLNIQPAIRNFVMRTNFNLLNSVAEHDCQTFFILHRTKYKPMHLEWEHFSDFFVLHSTKCKPMHLEWERFSLFSCWTKPNERPRARERDLARARRRDPAREKETPCERERERGFRRGLCVQYSAPFSYICVNIFCSRPPLKLKKKNSTERNVNPCILNWSVSQTDSR